MKGAECERERGALEVALHGLHAEAEPLERQ